MSRKRPPRFNIQFLGLHSDFLRQLKAMKKVLRLYGNQVDQPQAAGKAAEMDALGNFDNAMYSMGAVGMIAPFVETFFSQSLQRIGERWEMPPKIPHERWDAGRKIQWDCHYVLKDGKPRKAITEGILQISEALGLLPKFPRDVGKRLDALFSYRNRMFHHGFEWPPNERKAFQVQIANKKWPDTWFRWDADELTGKRDVVPWMFYLSREFIGDVIQMVDEIFDGVGEFIEENRKVLVDPYIVVRPRSR